MLYAFILLLITTIVIVIGTMSDMLRNEVFNQENFARLAILQDDKKPRPAFSLAKTQLAFWTVIVISSFIYVLIDGSKNGLVIPVLDAVNLALLGIAAGTTIVAKVIDSSQKDNPGDGVPQQDFPSKDFLTDIVSDANGVSIHRLQNVIWTVVVGAIYVAYVSNADIPKLPDSKVITTQLLELMGISTGAYLGLKIGENKNSGTKEAALKAAEDVSNSEQHER